MNTRTRCTLGATAIIALTASAHAVYIRHEMSFDLMRYSGGFQSIMDFNDGPAGIDVPLTESPDGVWDPQYHQTGIHGVNPAYTPPTQRGTAEDFTTISRVDIDVFFNIHPPPEDPGDVWRDMVCLNVFLTTDLGVYSFPLGTLANFRSLGPRDFISAPIVWTFGVHDGVPLYLNGDPANTDDLWLLRAGSTITSITIPAPAPTALGAIACIIGCAPRRR